MPSSARRGQRAGVGGRVWARAQATVSVVVASPTASRSWVCARRSALRSSSRPSAATTRAAAAGARASALSSVRAGAGSESAAGALIAPSGAAMVAERDRARNGMASPAPDPAGTLRVPAGLQGLEATSRAL